MGIMVKYIIVFDRFRNLSFIGLALYMRLFKKCHLNEGSELTPNVGQQIDVRMINAKHKRYYKSNIQ